MSRADHHGVAALQVGLLDDANAVHACDGDRAWEPSAWANLGLTHLRLGELDPASQAIDRAAALAPTSSEMAFLQGQVKQPAAGRTQRSHVFGAALTSTRRDYAFVTRLRRRLNPPAVPGGCRGANVARPACRASSRQSRGDSRAGSPRRQTRRCTEASGCSPSLEKRADTWPAVAVDQYHGLQRASSAQDFAEAARSVAVLRNALLPVPAYREDMLAIRNTWELIAEPFDRFLRLRASTSSPSPPDAALAFSQEALVLSDRLPGAPCWPSPSDGTSLPAVFAADSREVGRIGAPGTTLPFPGGGSARSPSASAVLAVDWNRDFRMDLVFAGAGGVRLFTQDGDGTFRDLTAAAAGIDEAVSADCFGAWTADFEMDGDLDIVVGTTAGPPLVLRNNGDGTWRRLQPFAGVAGLRGFAWGDLDGDGDPDATLLDAAGDLRLFENHQGGQFEPMNGPAGLNGLVGVRTRRHQR